MGGAGWDVGIDVSKLWLDAAVLQTGVAFRVGNDEAGWVELIGG